MESSLLLDRNYIAISVVGWKKAFKLLVRDKAEPIGGNTIKSIATCTNKFNVPSIIRLKHAVSYNCFSNRIRFSRNNVFLRDQYKCQYCSKTIAKSAVTIDHVFPISRGGKTDYLNCVACCKECNSRKGDRTPDEAGIKLLRAPKRPNFITLCCSMENLPKEWMDFISGV
jgi:5-methylcytosine-specific restriction endonuclease McrA